MWITDKVKKRAATRVWYQFKLLKRYMEAKTWKERESIMKASERVDSNLDELPIVMKKNLSVREADRFLCIGAAVPCIFLDIQGYRTCLPPMKEFYLKDIQKWIKDIPFLTIDDIPKLLYLPNENKK